MAMGVKTKGKESETKLSPTDVKVDFSDKLERFAYKNRDSLHDFLNVSCFNLLRFKWNIFFLYKQPLRFSSGFYWA